MNFKKKKILKDTRECTYEELSLKPIDLLISAPYVVKIIVLPGEG